MPIVRISDSILERQQDWLRLDSAEYHWGQFDVLTPIWKSDVTQS